MIIFSSCHTHALYESTQQVALRKSSPEMFSHTSRTVRVRSIPSDTEKESLVYHAQELCESQAEQKFFGIFPRRLHIGGQPLVSLAPQSGWQSGTITFPSKELKNRALK